MMPSRPGHVKMPSAGAKLRPDDRWRGSARERGYTVEWDKYSKWRLMQHPLCVRCKKQGRIVAATCTDHIRPTRYFPELFWEEANHQSLCRRCNAEKSVEDERLYGGKSGF